MNNIDKSTTSVLIIGATGYIGSAVVAEAVQQGYGRHHSNPIAEERCPA